MACDFIIVMGIVNLPAHQLLKFRIESLLQNSLD